MIIAVTFETVRAKIELVDQELKEVITDTRIVFGAQFIQKTHDGIDEGD